MVREETESENRAVECGLKDFDKGFVWWWGITGVLVRHSVPHPMWRTRPGTSGLPYIRPTYVLRIGLPKGPDVWAVFAGSGWVAISYPDSDH